MRSSRKFPSRAAKRGIVAVAIALTLFASQETARAMAAPKAQLMISATKPGTKAGPSCTTAPKDSKCELDLYRAKTTGTVYIFVRGTGVTKVNFHLNDGPGRTKPFVAKTAPFVFGAGTDTTDLEDGWNSVLAEVFTASGSFDVSARFKVANGATGSTTGAGSGGDSGDKPATSTGTSGGPTAAGVGSAAKAFNWGTPASVESMDNLTKFGKYTAEKDFGKKTPGNITLANGIATISGKSDGTTGGMAHKYSQKYGRWEARMKASGAEGCWRPVMLLWPDAENWPEGGEVDYAESGGDWSKVDFFLHYGKDNSQEHGEAKIDATKWNYYAVEWTPKHIIGYVNGKKFFESTDPKTLPPGPMHQTFQLDAQDGDGTCSINTQMQIDELKVYKV